MNPYSKCEPEELIVAAAILAPERMADVSADEITHPGLRALWGRISKLREEGRPVDLTLLLRGVNYPPDRMAAALNEALPFNAPEYAREMRRMRKKEALLELLGKSVDYFNRADCHLDDGIKRLIQRLAELT